MQGDKDNTDILRRKLCDPSRLSKALKAGAKVARSRDGSKSGETSVGSAPQSPRTVKPGDNLDDTPKKQDKKPVKATSVRLFVTNPSNEEDRGRGPNRAIVGGRAATPAFRNRGTNRSESTESEEYRPLSSNSTESSDSSYGGGMGLI